jgi:hypothetical protein
MTGRANHAQLAEIARKERARERRLERERRRLAKRVKQHANLERSNGHERSGRDLPVAFPIR